MGGEGGFHLGGFEPDAAHLDLLVDPAEIDERPVVGHAHEVAGPVEALAVQLHERLVVAAEVAGREADVGDAELTGRPERHPLEVLVDDPQGHAWRGPADGYLGRLIELGGQRLVDHAADDCFRGSVLVEDPEVATALEQPPRQAGAERLTADDEGGQRVVGRQETLEDLEVRGGRLAPGDVGGAGQGRQPLRPVVADRRRAGHRRRGAGRGSSP